MDRAGSGTNGANRSTTARLIAHGDDLWVVSLTVPIRQEDNGRTRLFPDRADVQDQPLIDLTGARSPGVPSRKLPRVTRSNDLADPTADPVAAAGAAAAAIAEHTGAATHDLAMILGSGWRPAADVLGAPDVELPLEQLPGFAAPTVGRATAAPIRSVRVGDRRVLVLLGRTHFYEGNGVAQVVHGVRTAAAAGCRTVVLTNAAGGLREGMPVGQPVLISDHLNLTAKSPLVGAQFIDLTDLYSRAAARHRPRDRPDADRGRLRRAARPALRDARRDPDAAHHGRRPGRHVHRAGGDRGAGARRWRCSGCRWSPTWPPG